ncbi:MAG: GDSL-type esterase/lipase family protein [Verrucomicrobiales bacterium]|nr:GDSL-type esterase/lipase family protein [Verrucomicrobiales bacterium]
MLQKRECFGMKWMGFLTLLTIGSAVSAEPELPVLVRSFETTARPAPVFQEGRFQPEAGETITFLGGNNVFDLQRTAQLETAIYLAWPDLHLKIRNLGWQGDTVYHQARPRFFYTKTGDPQPGSTPDIRERTTPGITFFLFGKMESLDHDAEIEKFGIAYRALLDEFQNRVTKRIVLVAPTPFFEVGPAASLATSRNETLSDYVNEIETIAAERKFLFVNLFEEFLEDLNPAFSSNGIHLTDSGHRKLAEIFASELNFPHKALHPSSPFHEAINLKNRYWQQFYHPTNWAFLFGDRQHVPASRDHIDTQKRWFVDEVNSLPGLILKTESEIHRYAKEVEK